MAALKNHQNLSRLLDASAILKTGKMKGRLKKGGAVGAGAGEKTAFLQTLTEHLSAAGAAAIDGKGTGKISGKAEFLQEAAGSPRLKAEVPVRVLSAGAAQGGGSKVSPEDAPKAGEEETLERDRPILQGAAGAAPDGNTLDPPGAVPAAGRGGLILSVRKDPSGLPPFRAVRETGDRQGPAGLPGQGEEGRFTGMLRKESAVPESPRPPAAQGDAGRPKDLPNGLSDLPGGKAGGAAPQAAAGRVSRIETKEDAGEAAKNAAQFQTAGGRDVKLESSVSAAAESRTLRGSHSGPGDETAAARSRTAPSGLGLKETQTPADEKKSAGDNDSGNRRDFLSYMKEPLKAAEGFREPAAVREPPSAKGTWKAASAENPSAPAEGSGLAAANGSAPALRTGKTEAAVVPDPQALMDRIAENSGILLRTGYSRIRLTLNPPRLGSLDLDLRIGRDRIRMVLTAENSDVRQTLQSNIEQLKTALEGQGLSIDRLDVLVQDRGGDRGQEPSQGTLSFGQEQTRQGHERSGGEEPEPVPSDGGFRDEFRDEKGISIFA